MRWPSSKRSRSISAFPRPWTARIAETNGDLLGSPELVNQDPYGKGWLAVLEVADAGAARNALMTAAEFMALAKIQAEAEVLR